MAHDAPPAETDLFALAARVRDQRSLTGAERAEIVATLERVGGPRKTWDGHAERYPDDDATSHAHHMHGVLAYVLNRPLKEV